MTDRSAPRTLLTLAALAAALAFPFFASGYHLYQGAQVLILAIALLGLNLLTGFNGQISLGHGAFFAIGGYGAAILTAKLGVPYFLAIPLASLVCFGAGFLFGFPALRFGGLYLALATFALAVATPQILAYQGLRRLDRRVERRVAAEAARAVRAAADDRPVALSGLPDLPPRSSTLRRATSSPVASGGRWWRCATSRSRPRRWASMRRSTRRPASGSARSTPASRAGLSALAVGFVSPESFGLALSLSFLVGIVVGGLASLGGVLFGALFIEFVPNLADQLSVSFGESAKALPGAIYGVLLILAMAVMPSGVAGALRAAMRWTTRTQ